MTKQTEAAAAEEKEMEHLQCCRGRSAGTSSSLSDTARGLYKKIYHMSHLLFQKLDLVWRTPLPGCARSRFYTPIVDVPSKVGICSILLEIPNMSADFGIA